MLIKIDHMVASLLAEDRGDLVEQLTKSRKMYSWFDGETIGDTIDNFALTNPRATFGDFIEWTKRTYMDRLRAHKDKAEFKAYKLQGDYNPTGSREGQARFGQHGEAAKGVSVISDAIPARPKVRTDVRKVAEPGQEAAVDAADAAIAEAVENPQTPPTDLSTLPPLESGQRPDVSEDPLAAFKARKF